MVVSFIQTINNTDVSSSRTVNLSTLDEDKVVSDAMDVLKRNTEKFFKSADNCSVLNNPIKFLGLNVGKFENIDTKKGNTIQDMFKRTIENKAKEASEKENNADTETEDEDGENKENEAGTNEVDKKDDEHEQVEKEDDQVDPEEEKKSFFLNYHKMRRKAEEEKKAEEERKAKEAEMEAQNIDDNENTFTDDMLVSELRDNGDSHQQQRPSSPIPSTSTASDYRHTYAEFYQPPQIDIPKVECKQCGKMIAEHEYQVHTDAHLAFQLTQEQRTEFQSQLKRSIPAVTPAAKKQKITNNKPQTPKNVLSIQKFLVKKEENSANEESTDQAVETEKCTECGKNIPIVDLFEHMDFHAAKKLHDELMRTEALANRANNNVDRTPNTQSESTSKAKKGKKNANNKTGSSSGTPVAMKNIASFFQNS